MHLTHVTVAAASLVVLLGEYIGAEQVCPKIDVHQHAEVIRDLIAIPCPDDREPCGDDGYSAFRTDAALIEGTMEQMRRHQIVLAFISTISEQEHQLESWVAASPERFVVGRQWRSAAGAPDISDLRSDVTSGKVGFLGEIGTQYSGMEPSDPALEPYFALAAELDLPVLVHTAGIGAPVPGFRIAAGDPLLLEPVLRKHRGLRLYVENAGYPFAESMIAVMHMYPSVYADISTISWLLPRTAFHDYLSRLVRAGFADRLMFGSDQSSWPETIGWAVEALEAAPFLSAEDRCDIFFNNAVRFFGLDAEALRETPWLEREAF